jgi:hypothetical protein
VKKFNLLSISIPMSIPAKAIVLIPILLCLLSTPAQPQKPKYPTAPPPLTTGPGTGPDPQPVPSPLTARRHIDLVKLQQEADELSKIAQTIPTDVTSVRHNMLPKDLLEKLKRIEKLSKHLRRELTP